MQTADARWTRPETTPLPGSSWRGAGRRNGAARSGSPMGVPRRPIQCHLARPRRRDGRGRHGAVEPGGRRPACGLAGRRGAGPGVGCRVGRVLPVPRRPRGAHRCGVCAVVQPGGSARDSRSHRGGRRAWRDVMYLTGARHFPTDPAPMRGETEGDTRSITRASPQTDHVNVIIWAACQDEAWRRGSSTAGRRRRASRLTDDPVAAHRRAHARFGHPAGGRRSAAGRTSRAAS